MVSAGIAPTRENGTHALHQVNAGVLLDGGQSIRALAESLGSADPGVTLPFSSHPVPASEERTKRAVDQALRGGALVDGSTACAPDVHQEAL